MILKLILTGADLSNADLNGFAPYGRLFSGNDNRASGSFRPSAYGFKADLRGANLVAANLTGTNLMETDLRDGNLMEAILMDSHFSGTYLD